MRTGWDTNTSHGCPGGVFWADFPTSWVKKYLVITTTIRQMLQLCTSNSILGSDSFNRNHLPFCRNFHSSSWVERQQFLRLLRICSEMLRVDHRMFDLLQSSLRDDVRQCNFSCWICRWTVFTSSSLCMFPVLIFHFAPLLTEYIKIGASTVITKEFTLEQQRCCTDRQKMKHSWKWHRVSSTVP